jgi:hypothetical protein
MTDMSETVEIDAVRAAISEYPDGFDLSALHMSPRLSAQVGKNVRAAMKAAEPRVLQATVAEWLGLSQGAVWKRLEGQTLWTVGELVVVARRLGTSIDDLLAGIGDVAAA